MPELLSNLKEKECSMCHQFKPREQFYKNRSKKDGLTNLCRLCHKVSHKEYWVKWAVDRKRGQIKVPEEKECKKCHQVKPASMFYKSYNRKDGLDYICKTCKSKKRVKLIKKWKNGRNINKIKVKAKKCKKCRKILPISHFNKSIYYKDGFDSLCRKCSMELTQEYKIKWAEDRDKSPSNIDEKFCPSCNRVLPLSAFYVDDYTKDGLRTYCIECELRKAELNTVKWSEERLQIKEIKKEKICNICQRKLPVSEFHKSRRYKDGLCASCINCQKIRQLEYVEKWKKFRDNNDEVLVAKECNVCGKILPVSSFSLNKKHKDGLLGTCKDCIESRHQEYMVKWKTEQLKHKIDFTRSEDLFPTFEKKCYSCHKILPVTYFYHSTRKKDGYASSCKECAKKIVKESRERIKKNARRIIPPEKFCKKCDRLLPSINFNKNIHHSDGLSAYCNECNRKREREYRNRPDVREKLKEKKRLYDSRPEVVKRKREYSREYARRPEIKDKRKKYQREYKKRPGVSERLRHYQLEYRRTKRVQ
jgi:hypothetical protein